MRWPDDDLFDEDREPTLEEIERWQKSQIKKKELIKQVPELGKENEEILKR